MDSNNQQNFSAVYSDSLLTGKGTPVTQNMTVVPPNQGQTSSFDIVFWIIKFIKYWYILLIGLVLAVGLANIKNKSWTPQYKTTTTVLIQEDKKQGFGNTFGYSSQVQQNNNNQVLMYGSYDLIAKAVNQLNVTNELYQKRRFKNITLYKSGPVEIESNFIAPDAYHMEFEIVGLDEDTYQVVYAGDGIRPSFKQSGEYGKYLQHSLFFILVNKTDAFTEKYDLFFRFISKAALVGDYSGRLNFQFVMEGSSVLEISLVGAVAQRDVDFLTILNQQFFEDNLTRKNESSQKAIDFIDEQLMIIRDSITSSESKLNAYQMKTGMYTQDKSTRAYTELETLDKRKAELRLQKEYLDDLLYV